MPQKKMGARSRSPGRRDPGTRPGRKAAPRTRVGPRRRAAPRTRAGPRRRAPRTRQIMGKPRPRRPPGAGAAAAAADRKNEARRRRRTRRIRRIRKRRKRQMIFPRRKMRERTRASGPRRTQKSMGHLARWRPSGFATCRLRRKVCSWRMATGTKRRLDARAAGH